MTDFEGERVCCSLTLTDGLCLRPKKCLSIVVGKWDGEDSLCAMEVRRVNCNRVVMYIDIPLEEKIRLVTLWIFLFFFSKSTAMQVKRTERDVLGNCKLTITIY